MTNVLSKFPSIPTTCKEYVHPWTDSCWNSTAGLLIQASCHSLRVYTAVYLFSLLMRGRIPTLRDIKRTILGIIQSSAFLSINGFTFVMFACIIRNLIGKFYISTVAFIPSLFASFAAICIERPSRRPLLAIYVSNVATESVWKMLESRGYVKSISHGQTIIFGISISTLLYFYRLGYHRIYKDSLFDILRFIVGRNEEIALVPREEEQEVNRINDEEEVIQQEQSLQQQQQSESRSTRRNNYYYISMVVRLYSKFLKFLKAQKRHHLCPHNNSCIYYSLRGGLKLFTVGFGLQVTLKLVLQLQKIIQFKAKLGKTLFNRNTLKLGMFLGGFSLLYKSISCIMRHITGFDCPSYAIPAGLVASVAFTQYPDTTVSLYMLWKMLQIAYNVGIKKGIVPEVPGFTMFLYCLSTGILFHASLVEPLNLRPSYWKFLHSLSGGRVGLMDRKSFDVWGFDSSHQVEEVIKKTHTAMKQVKFAFV